MGYDPRIAIFSDLCAIRSGKAMQPQNISVPTQIRGPNQKDAHHHHQEASVSATGAR